MFNLPIGVNFVNMFGMPQNTCIQCFILHKFYLFIYLMSANILVPSQSQIYVCKLWSEVSYLTRILLC